MPLSLAGLRGEFTVNAPGYWLRQAAEELGTPIIATVVPRLPSEKAIAMTAIFVGATSPARIVRFFRGVDGVKVSIAKRDPSAGVVVRLVLNRPTQFDRLIWRVPGRVSLTANPDGMVMVTLRSAWLRRSEAL